MLEVNDKTLKNFIENFLNNMLFGDLPTEQLENLKTFLVDYLKKLYQDRPNDIIKLIEQVDSINPFMIKLALGYGILEDDVVDLTKILFMKINEFFYKKGSFDVLKYISNVLKYYGITSYIKKVIYDKHTDSWVLEDVFDGTRETTDIEEFLTHGHLVTKKEYALNTFADGYDTIVIYIKMELSAKVDDRMQHPVALLHAYTISKYKNDIFQFYINGNTYDLNLKNFLFFLQYFYLKYTKMRNPKFELDESGLEMWSLFITDPDDMEVAADLLQSLLTGEFNNREGIDYFLRVSTRLLNKYKIKTKPLTLNEISERAHKINEQLATDIDNLKTVDEYIMNLSITLLYLEIHLNKFPVNSQLDEAAKNTIKYLVNFVAFSLIQDYVGITKNLILKFKKYFLPIYTQFFYEIVKSFKIKNEYFRIYTEEIHKLFFKIRNSSLFEIQDEEKIQIELSQKDINEITDSMHSLIKLKFKYDINTNDKSFFIINTNKASLTKTQDIQSIYIEKVQKNKLDIIDSMTTIISTTPTGKLKTKDNLYMFLKTSEYSLFEIQDKQINNIKISKLNNNIVTDAISNKIQISPKEMLYKKDKWKINLYLTFNSLIGVSDISSISIVQNQFDRTEISDSVVITIK